MRGQRRFVSNDTIEQVTEGRVRAYEARTGRPVKLPVPVEQIVETVLGLDFDWDEIDEHPGEQILAGLDARNRKVLLNAKHQALFERTPGLLRSTIGHEAGHWDVDIDRAAIDHPTFAGFDLTAHVVHRHARRSDVLARVLDRAVRDPRAYQLYRKLTAGEDAPEVKSAVDRYQSALLMPAWLMHEAASRHDLLSWGGLYRLKDGAGVTISNLVVRLERLGLIWVHQQSRTVYRSKDAFNGQGTLF
jgi:hypothetical protein